MLILMNYEEMDGEFGQASIELFMKLMTHSVIRQQEREKYQL
jgi:hypothetical protein